MFYLIEGLDLSGKSTLCRLLRDHLGLPLRRNSLLEPGANHLFEAAREAHIAGSADDASIGQMFLEALEYELDQYQPASSPHLQDSTILTRSLTYHTALENQDLAARFSRLFPHHPVPALVFLCRPTIAVRLRRLEGRISRGNDTPEDFVVRDNPEMFRKMEEMIESVACRWPNMHLIDTSGLEDQEQRAQIVATVAGHIQTHLKSLTEKLCRQLIHPPKSSSAT